MSINPLPAYVNSGSEDTDANTGPPKKRQKRRHHNPFSNAPPQPAAPSPANRCNPFSFPTAPNASPYIRPGTSIPHGRPRPSTSDCCIRCAKHLASSRCHNSCNAVFAGSRAVTKCWRCQSLNQPCLPVPEAAKKIVQQAFQLRDEIENETARIKAAVLSKERAKQDFVILARVLKGLEEGDDGTGKTDVVELVERA